MKRVNICHRHFADNLHNKISKEKKLLYECKPVHTIIPVTQEKDNLPPNAIFEIIETPRKTPGQNIFQDQLKILKKIGYN